jgi:hypothetical protein
MNLRPFRVKWIDRARRLSGGAMSAHVSACQQRIPRKPLIWNEK